MTPIMCKECGQVIQKRTKDSVEKYKTRKYCSEPCVRANFKKNRIGWFSYG